MMSALLHCHLYNKTGLTFSYMNDQEHYFSKECKDDSSNLGLDKLSTFAMPLAFGIVVFESTFSLDPIMSHLA